MGKSMQELALKKGAAEGVDYENIPEERGGQFTPPPHPGDYSFKLPGDLSKVWDVFEDAEEKQWVSMVFDDDNPLTITNAQAGNEEEVGRTVNIRINNKPRGRGKEKIPVSDLTYLVRVLDPSARPGAGIKDQAKLNESFIAEMKKHGGKEFLAALAYQTNCSEKRDAYFEETDPATGAPTGRTAKRETAPGSYQQGCGARYYQGDWPKENGRYLPQRKCSKCGAVLNAFPQLERFRSLVAAAQ